MPAARITIAGLAALLIASAAPAQTPAAKDGIKSEPQEALVTKNRDSMPKSSPNQQQGSGAVQVQETPKKK
jgi:hypothetical protein